MFRQIISVILTRNTFIYVLNTYSFHTQWLRMLVAQDSVKGKYNNIHQYNISIAATIEMRAFFNNLLIIIIIIIIVIWLKSVKYF